MSGRLPLDWGLKNVKLVGYRCLSFIVINLVFELLGVHLQLEFLGHFLVKGELKLFFNFKLHESVRVVKIFKFCALLYFKR